MQKNWMQIQPMREMDAFCITERKFIYLSLRGSLTANQLRKFLFCDYKVMSTLEFACSSSFLTFAFLPKCKCRTTAGL